MPFRDPEARRVYQRERMKRLRRVDADYRRRLARLSEEWYQRLRRRLWEAYGGRCCYCGKALRFDRMELDHYNPRSNGGRETAANLRPSCRKCNVLKGDRVPEQPTLPLTGPARVC